MSEKTYTSNMSSQLDYSNWNQFVLTRTNMTDPFTDDEYNSCIEALTKYNAVAINWEQGSVVRQLQLVSKTNLGVLTFSCTRNKIVESWTVAASSPHTITHDVYDVDNGITPLVNTGTKIAEGTINGQQFELFAPSGDCKVEIFNCTEPNWPNPIEMFNSYNDGKDVVIVRTSFSSVIYSVWRLENVVEDLGSVKNYTLEFQNEDGDTTATHKMKRVKFHSTDYENWTTTEKTFYYPERETIAPNWNALDVSNYKKGTLVYRAGVLYRCKTNSPSGSWVDLEWEETDISKEISRISGDTGVVVFEVSYSESIADYVYPTYEEVASAVSAGKMPVILLYVHNSPIRRCFVFRWLSGGYIYLDNNSRYVKISNANVVETGYINDKNLAADYNPTATYGVGNYCVYQNELFVCTTDIVVAEEWDGSHWQRTSMSDIVGNVETLLAAL